MRCSFPTICIFYYELGSNKSPVCTLNDFEINYTNIKKIEECTSHKTYQENSKSWKILLANPEIKV